MTARKCIKCQIIYGCANPGEVWKYCEDCEHLAEHRFICVEEVSGGLCTKCKDDWLECRRKITQERGSNT